MKTLSQKRLRVCLAINLRRARIMKARKDHAERRWSVLEALQIRGELRRGFAPMDLQPCTDR